MFGNNVMDMENMSREEVEEKIRQLMRRQAMIRNSGRADIYNQLSAVLSQFLHHYDSKYRNQVT
jgi:hypothetical protein